MEKKKVRDLAKGEYFILNPIEEPNASQVWVRGEYIREAKKYSITGVINAQNGTVSLSNLI